MIFVLFERSLTLRFFVTYSVSTPVFISVEGEEFCGHYTDVLDEYPFGDCGVVKNNLTIN